MSSKEAIESIAPGSARVTTSNGDVYEHASIISVERYTIQAVVDGSPIVFFKAGIVSIEDERQHRTAN